MLSFVLLLTCLNFNAIFVGTEKKVPEKVLKALEVVGLEFLILNHLIFIFSIISLIFIISLNSLKFFLKYRVFFFSALVILIFLGILVFNEQRCEMNKKAARKKNKKEKEAALEDLKKTIVEEIKASLPVGENFDKEDETSGLLDQVFEGVSKFDEIIKNNDHLKDKKDDITNKVNEIERKFEASEKESEAQDLILNQKKKENEEKILKIFYVALAIVAFCSFYFGNLQVFLAVINFAIIVYFGEISLQNFFGKAKFEGGHNDLPNMFRNAGGHHHPH